MKSLIIVSTLFSLLICSPLAAIEDKINPGQPLGKMIKEQGVVHLKRYGVRFDDESGTMQLKGLYKIIIGDPHELEYAMHLNRLSGFDGSIFAMTPHSKDHWRWVRVHRPNEITKGHKVTTIVKKDQLPIPFNTMPDDLLSKIDFFNMYRNNDDVTVVYILEQTELLECEEIFDYICGKKMQPQESVGL